MTGRHPQQVGSAPSTADTGDPGGAVAPASYRRLPARAPERIARFLLGCGLTAAPTWAQAPLLQDGAATLHQARLDWTLGQPPLPPLAVPSFEVGWGGAEGDGAYTPLVGGEGLGTGTRGWGLGLQGSYVHEGWSFSATALALREQGRTVAVLQRGALAFQAPSGWRLALEQTPLAWGSGLNGGDLLGAAARPIPRLSIATPEVPWPFGPSRVEAFAGRLDADRPIPPWLPDREARVAARAAGLDLQPRNLWGVAVQAAFGPLAEGRLAALSLDGGRGIEGRSAPASARTASLAELRLRLPALAGLLRARGASVQLSRSQAPGGGELRETVARGIAGAGVAWDGWDLGIEYAQSAPPGPPATFGQPACFAGFSTRGDPLGPAFDRSTLTRTLELGLPLCQEGLGRLRCVRATAPLQHPAGTGSWFLQAEAQWRTPTGRIGASLASRRDDAGAAAPRSGWALSLFQAFRVF